MQIIDYAKMMGLATFWGVLLSCGSPKKEKLISFLTTELNISNRTIELNTQETLRKLEEKRQSARTANKAEIWFSKADSINKLTSTFMTLLDKASSSKENLQNIRPALNKYYADVFNIEKIIKIQFLDYSLVQLLRIDTLLKLCENSTLNSTKQIIQSIIKNLVYRTTVFCNEQVGSIDDDFFEIFEGFVGQNTTILKPKEKLKIYAGVGAFSRNVKPSIKIYNNPIEINDQGLAIYEIKASPKAGNYTVPVEIRYTNQTTGLEDSMTYTVTYTVTNPCK